MTTIPEVPLTGRAPTSPGDFYDASLTAPLHYVESLTVTDHIPATRVKATITSAQNNLGVAGYYETHIAGTTTGHTYGHGSWINVDAGAVLSAGHIIVPIEGGIYTSEAQAAARLVFGAQYQAVLTGAPATLFAWRLNSDQLITALIQGVNPNSVGYVVDATTDDGKVGGIPLVEVSGAVRWVRVYSGAS